MRRLFLIILLVGVAAASALPLSAFTAAKAGLESRQPIWLDVRDRIQVKGAPLGCLVTRVGRAKVVDCRIAGPLAGSYGTITGAKRVLVVRFKSDRVAKVVFEAKHQGASRTCS